eukprot:7071225-Prymnesium_polylepis.1
MAAPRRMRLVRGRLGCGRAWQPRSQLGGSLLGVPADSSSDEEGLCVTSRDADSALRRHDGELNMYM